MIELRRMLFPYGMAKNPNGTWTFFNRQYKPVGVHTEDWAEWQVPEHSVKFKRQPSIATLRKLDVHGEGTGDRIYFYNDGSVPTRSAATMKAYLTKLETIMKLTIKRVD